MTSTDIVTTLLVFAIGTAAWCLIGAALVSHRRLTDIIERHGHWIVPAVFITIGIYIWISLRDGRSTAGRSKIACVAGGSDGLGLDAPR